MKKKTGLLGIFIFFIHLASAQIADKNPDETKSDSSGVKFGEFVKGTPFGAKLYKGNYTDAQDLIDNIKVLCKGKAVFIDYWATWCKPCIAAMRNNKILYFQTRKLPIEFIYICSDAGTEMYMWENQIEIQDQPGIHIFVQDDIIRQMWKIFQIGGGFPTYVFIDRNGNFKKDAIPLNSSTTSDRLKELIK